jgi:WD40 repeat protein
VSVRKEVASLAGHTSYVLSVAFRQHTVSGGSDNLVKVWSVSARKEVASLAGHTSNVMSVALRLQSRRATYCFWKFGQVGEGAPS